MSGEINLTFEEAIFYYTNYFKEIHRGRNYKELKRKIHTKTF